MFAQLRKFFRPCGPADRRMSGGALAPEPDAVGGTPVLDPAALARLTELDPKGENRLLERVLKAFQSSVGRLRPQAEAARASDDRATLRLVAHTLKSSSASIGAVRLSQSCARIESMIRLDSDDGLDSQLDAWSVALDEVLAAIDRLLKDHP